MDQPARAVAGDIPMRRRASNADQRAGQGSAQRAHPAYRNAGCDARRTSMQEARRDRGPLMARGAKEWIHPVLATVSCYPYACGDTPFAQEAVVPSSIARPDAAAAQALRRRSAHAEAEDPAVAVLRAPAPRRGRRRHAHPGRPAVAARMSRQKAALDDWMKDIAPSTGCASGSATSLRAGWSSSAATGRVAPARRGPRSPARDRGEGHADAGVRRARRGAQRRGGAARGAAARRMRRGLRGVRVHRAEPWPSVFANCWTKV